jgi:hypothetical protein
MTSLGTRHSNVTYRHLASLYDFQRKLWTSAYWLAKTATLSRCSIHPMRTRPRIPLGQVAISRLPIIFPDRSDANERDCPGWADSSRRSLS